MSIAEFTITRTFAAPRETLWRAWTDPASAARWWHPHEVTTPPESVSIDLRAGGRYSYLMIDPDGGQWPVAGEYLEVDAPRRLRFTWAGDEVTSAGPAPVITVDLSEAGEGRTRMRFHMSGHADDSGTEYSVHDGWSEAFEELEDLLSASATL